MSKITVVLLTACVMLVSMSCNRRPSMEKIAEQANRECPITVPGIGHIKSIEYDGEVLMYDCLVLTRAFKLKDLEGKEEIMKSAIAPMLSGILKENPEMAEALIGENASLGVRYYTNGPKGAEVTIVFSPDEIKRVKEGEVADDAVSKLKSQIAMTSAQCPIKVDEDMEITDVTAADGYLVYVYAVDENGDGDAINRIENNRDEMTAHMLEMIKGGGSDIRPIVELTKSAGYGFIYRYIGNESGRSCEIKIEHDQL